MDKRLEMNLLKSNCYLVNDTYYFVSERFDSLYYKTDEYTERRALQFSNNLRLMLNDTKSSVPISHIQMDKKMKLDIIKDQFKQLRSINSSN